MNFVKQRSSAPTSQRDVHFKRTDFSLWVQSIESKETVIAEQNGQLAEGVQYILQNGESYCNFIELNSLFHKDEVFLMAIERRLDAPNSKSGLSLVQ